MGARSTSEGVYEQFFSQINNLYPALGGQPIVDF